MPSVTRATYYSALVDRLFADRPHRRGTATASGSTTTLVDTGKFQSSMTLTSPLVGCWIRLQNGNGAAEYAIISAVTNSTGTLTLDRTVTSTDTSTNWWITYDKHPNILENAINQVLRNIFVPSLFPLSSHILASDDNDMSASNTTGPAADPAVWTASSSTLVKSTTRFFFTGSQSLKVTALGSNGRAELATDYFVNANHSYAVGALCSVTTADSAELRVVNVDSANATIENATGDELAWSDFQFQFTPPTGCENIDVWMISSASGDVTYWQDLYIRDLEQRVFPGPSWLIWPSQVLGAYIIPRGSIDPSGDNGYRTLSRFWEPNFITPFPSNLRATQELMLQIEAPTQERIYLYAMRPATALTADVQGSALSTDSSASYLDTDAVVENCLAILNMPESKANQYLRVLRERTLRSDYSAPQPKAIAWYGQ